MHGWHHVEQNRGRTWLANGWWLCWTSHNSDVSSDDGCIHAYPIHNTCPYDTYLLSNTCDCRYWSRSKCYPLPHRHLPWRENRGGCELVALLLSSALLTSTTHLWSWDVCPWVKTWVVVELLWALGSSVSFCGVCLLLLRFHRTTDCITPLLSYLPLSRSTFLLSYADTSDCPFPLSYPLSPRIFNRPWRYLVALYLSLYQWLFPYLVRYIDSQSGDTVGLGLCLLCLPTLTRSRSSGSI